jgi:hypothetical protein
LQGREGLEQPAILAFPFVAGNMGGTGHTAG